MNLKLQATYREIEANEVRYDAWNVDDADIVLVAFGLSARIASKVMDVMRDNGKKVGLVKPLTLWPYPSQILNDLADKAKGFFVMELNAGQMVEDVKLAVNGKREVGFYGRMGGMIYSPDEVVEQVEAFAAKLGV